MSGTAKTVVSEESEAGYVGQVRNAFRSSPSSIAVDSSRPATPPTPDHAAGRLVTSSFVFNETVTLCRNRLGHPIAVSVGDLLRDPDVVELIRVSADDEQEAWDLFVGRADKSYSFTDCTSFVLMRRLGMACAAAIDADFGREGFRTVP